MTMHQHLYDGKAKTMFATADIHTLIQYFKDDATAFNAQKHDILAGKGVLNNSISEHIMRELAEARIPTHFLERISDREQRIRKVEIIPVEVIVRNKAAGSLVRRLASRHIPISEGTPLPHPLIEYTLKNDNLGDPLITAEHPVIFGFASHKELAIINHLALEINDFLLSLFGDIGIDLIDFKLEFGRLSTDNTTIVLADEISPDNCRLWDKESGTKKDKDRFREDLGGFIEAYQDIANRLENVLT